MDRKFVEEGGVWQQKEVYHNIFLVSTSRSHLKRIGRGSRPARRGCRLPEMSEGVTTMPSKYCPNDPARSQWLWRK